MNRLVRKFGKYTLATFIIMGAGLILFLVTPLLLWLWDFDSDVVGLLVFGVGLLMCVAGLVLRGAKNNFWKRLAIAIPVMVGIWILFRVILWFV